MNPKELFRLLSTLYGVGFVVCMVMFSLTTTFVAGLFFGVGALMSMLLALLFAAASYEKSSTRTGDPDGA